MMCPSSLRLAWADQLAAWLPSELLEREPPEPELGGKAGAKRAKARAAARRRVGTDLANITVIRTGAVNPRFRLLPMVRLLIWQPSLPVSVSSVWVC